MRELRREREREKRGGRGKLIYIVQLSKKVGVRPSSPPPPQKKKNNPYPQ